MRLGLVALIVWFSASHLKTSSYERPLANFLRSTSFCVFQIRVVAVLKLVKRSSIGELITGD